MSNLKELISNIENKRAEAAISAEDADPRVRPGVEALVRNAKRDLEPIEANYRETVIANVVLIAVEGPGSVEFAQTAANDFGTPIVDYDLALNRIKTSVKNKSNRPEFSTQEFFMVMDELNKIKIEYSMLQLAAPKVNPAVDRVYNRAINEAIETVISVNYGEDLSSAIVRREIGKIALKLKFTGKHLPVVLYNYKGSLSETFLPRPLVVVSVKKEESNKEFVEEILTQIKNRLTGTVLQVAPKGPSRTKRKPTSSETAEQTE